MTGPGWPDARGWVGISVVGMSVMLLWMMKDPALREDEFFQTIATLVIGTGFVGGVVSWAYAATKGGGELADKNAEALKQRASDDAGRVQSVPEQMNVSADTVNVEEVKP